MKKIKNIFFDLIIFFAFLAYVSSIWYIKVYGDIGVSAILSTLRNGIVGTSSSIIQNYIINGIIPAFALAIFFIICIRIIEKRTLKKLNVLICTCAIILVIMAAQTVGVPSFLKARMVRGKLYDEQYVSPLDVEIKFPEEKRNLIYIFLESMETSYLSAEYGGGLEYTVIPNLYQLANENINFSHNDMVGGMYPSFCTSWTIAALVGQTSGISLTGGIDGASYGTLPAFLPGVYTINDLLADNGYNQTFFIGSDAAFGGRDSYFTDHGVNNIYDYYTAIDNGWIPQDYKVWWGYEDIKLFDFAKESVLELAQQDEPFAFITLTTDTHHVGGYKCDECKDEFDFTYENAISCSDRQVYKFVEWIKTQDFYENTTIVIAGDHLSMDAEYFNATMPTYDRKIYNCIINSAIEPENSKNRLFTAHDMFPTTVAALGCEIEGNRLGLGTNLFSKEKTLSEIYGVNEFNGLLSAYSEYYMENFMYN